MMRSTKVLVVDDMASNAQVIEAVLEDEHEVLLAYSGEQALLILQENMDIDLVLLDIVMPDMDGYKVCEKIKSNKNFEHIPVIFLTSEDSQESEERGFQFGAVDYITKPIRPAILLMRVKTHITLKRTQEKLRDMALHDQLTTLYNRYYLEESGSKSFAYTKRHQAQLSVAMLDIDHFKNVNDTYGHDVGDVVLKAVALLLKDNVREEDVVARIGGEEFVIIFKDTNIKDSFSKVENIRQKVQASSPNNIEITISIGMTQINASSESFDALLKQADQALYEAKESGRNQTKIYSGN